MKYSVHPSRQSLPEAFRQDHATGFQPDLPVSQWEIGTMRNFVYAVIDHAEKAAVIVDPQKDLSPILPVLEQEGIRLVGVLLTHTHPDHVAGLPTLLEKIPALPIFLHRKDAWRIEKKNPSAKLRFLEDGDMIRAGNLPVKAFHAPGHSAGGLFFEIKGDGHTFVPTGDTLFIRDCGRTDLETGSSAEMFTTLQRIRRLFQPDTILLPGHHYAFETATLLAAELDENPALRCESVEELENLP